MAMFLMTLQKNQEWFSASSGRISTLCAVFMVLLLTFNFRKYIRNNIEIICYLTTFRRLSGGGWLFGRQEASCMPDCQGVAKQDFFRRTAK